MQNRPDNAQLVNTATAAHFNAIAALGHVGVTGELFANTFTDKQPDLAQLRSYCERLYKMNEQCIDTSWQLLCFADEDITQQYIQAIDPTTAETLRDKQRASFLHYLAFRGNTNLLELALAKISNADQVGTQHGQTILHWAAASDSVDAVKLIIKKFPQLVNSKTSSQQNVLHSAAHAGSMYTMDYLIKHFPQLTEEPTCFAENILHKVIQSGSTRLFHFLCRYHAFLTARLWVDAHNYENGHDTCISIDEFARNKMLTSPSQILMQLLADITKQYFTTTQLQLNEIEVIDAFYVKWLNYLKLQSNDPKIKQLLSVLSHNVWPMLSIYISKLTSFDKFDSLEKIDFFKVAPEDDADTQKAKCNVMLLFICHSNWNANADNQWILIANEKLRSLMQQWEQKIAKIDPKDINQYVVRRLHLAIMQSPLFLSQLGQDYPPIKRFIIQALRSHSIHVAEAPLLSKAAAYVSSVPTRNLSTFACAWLRFSTEITAKHIVQAALNHLKVGWLNIEAAKREFDKLYSMDPENALAELSSAMPAVPENTNAFYYLLQYQAVILTKQGRFDEAYSYFYSIDKKYSAELHDKSTHVRLLQATSSLAMAKKAKSNEDKYKHSDEADEKKRLVYEADKHMYLDEVASHFSLINALTSKEEVKVFEKIIADIQADETMRHYFNTKHAISFQLFKLTPIQTAAAAAAAAAVSTTSTSAAAATQRVTRREGLFSSALLEEAGDVPEHSIQNTYNSL